MEKNNIKIAIAMSGGVDSSVAAYLALTEGNAATGVTMRLCGGASEEEDRAAAVCERLGCPHLVWDLQSEFRAQVMERFVRAYAEGLTPNPCIVCNRYIKFGLFMDKAREIDADLVATGHYARISRQGSRLLLQKAVDKAKDQSYVLYSLSQEVLGRVRFPLGALTKPEVREIARAQGFENADRSESQDICFVPDGDYAVFIERYTGKTFPCGDFTDMQGNVLGTHKGIIRYTVGQRRGLGLALPASMYVVEKDVQHNRVRLGFQKDLLSDTVEVGDINLIACESLDRPERLSVKIRYNQSEQPATVEQTDRNHLRIRFDVPQRAVTAGQAAVLYDGDTVVGGGTIM